MPKNRILILSNSYPSQAKPFAGIFVKNQINELKRRGIYSVYTFVLQRTFTGLAGSVVKYIRTFVRFIPLIFQRYDLLHLHFFFPFIWVVVIYKLFRPSTLVVVTFHGSDLHLRFKGAISNILHRYALSKVDFIHCVGHDLADELQKTLGSDADLVIPVGIDKTIFYVDKIISQKKAYDFIFVGSFTMGKGIDLILEAISMTEKKEFVFCFIGSGPEEYLIRKCSDSQNITILKNLHQNDIVKIMNQSRFLLLPSRYESFGLVVTEALYCGVPCIVSKVGGMKEQITDSFNGILIDSLSGDGVALAMERAITMTELEYSVMSENAENSNGRYSLESVVDQLEGIYSALISNKIN